MSEERYPRVYEGDALEGINIPSPWAGLIRRVEVASETTMVVELSYERVTIDIHAPADGGTYELGARVFADYSCSDPGGSTFTATSRPRTSSCA